MSLCAWQAGWPRRLRRGRMSPRDFTLSFPLPIEDCTCLFLAFHISFNYGGLKLRFRRGRRTHLSTVWIKSLIYRLIYFSSHLQRKMIPLIYRLVYFPAQMTVIVCAFLLRGGNSVGAITTYFTTPLYLL